MTTVWDIYSTRHLDVARPDLLALESGWHDDDAIWILDFFEEGLFLNHCLGDVEESRIEDLYNDISECCYKADLMMAIAESQEKCDRILAQHRHGLLSLLIDLKMEMLKAGFRFAEPSPGISSRAEAKVRP